MTEDPCLASISGLLGFPQVTEVNVRSGPGTNYSIAFKAPIGMSSLYILDIIPDNEGKGLNGKIYQWFKLEFHGGPIGWVRDDLISIQGHCEDHEYGIVPPGTTAFALTRHPLTINPPETAHKDSMPLVPARSEKSHGITDLERVQKAALAITATFEGNGYAAYNNYDSGIISYGIIQFTLAAGTLATVINNYLVRSNSPIAQQIHAYQTRIQAKDTTLCRDTNLRDLLQQAADEPQMRQVQDELAISNYWDRTIKTYVLTRGYELPLTYALLFDISVNFGVGDGFVRMAERDLGVPTHSRPDQRGLSEQRIITRVAELRKISHDKQAVRDNLPGLRVRGDFWVSLLQAGDWHLMGDSNGFVYPKGRRIQVANP